MASLRLAVGLIFIILGIIGMVSAVWEFIKSFAILQIPIVSDFYNLIAPTALQDQGMYFFGGLIVFAIGYWLVRSHLRKEGITK